MFSLTALAQMWLESWGRGDRLVIVKRQMMTTRREHVLPRQFSEAFLLLKN